MPHSRTMLYICMVVCCILTSGCIRLFGTVYKRVPDPQASDFVTVVNVSGTILELADGSQFRIVGIRAGESDVCRDLLQQKLIERVKGCLTILLETHNGMARVSQSGDYAPDRPGIVLFPTVVEIPPIRGDVGLDLIRHGYARVYLSEIPDKELRKEYEAAQVDAKQHRRGMWSVQSTTNEITPKAKPD